MLLRLTMSETELMRIDERRKYMHKIRRESRQIWAILGELNMNPVCRSLFFSWEKREDAKFVICDKPG